MGSSIYSTYAEDGDYYGNKAFKLNPDIGVIVVCARENASLWYALKGAFAGDCYRRRRLLSKNLWRSEYFWHDSFGVYWNRWIGCRVRGHRNVKNIAELHHTGGPRHMHCFGCERDVTEEFWLDALREAEDKL